MVVVLIDDGKKHTLEIWCAFPGNEDLLEFISLQTTTIRRRARGTMPMLQTGTNIERIRETLHKQSDRQKQSILFIRQVLDC